MQTLYPPGPEWESGSRGTLQTMSMFVGQFGGPHPWPQSSSIQVDFSFTELEGEDIGFVRDLYTTVVSGGDRRPKKFQTKKAPIAFLNYLGFRMTPSKEEICWQL